MITNDDVTKLAGLARIAISEDEKGQIRKDLDSIVGYVSEVQKVSADEPKPEERVGLVKNVMRDDAVTQESGEYTDGVLENAPETEAGYIKVKKILS